MADRNSENRAQTQAVPHDGRKGAPDGENSQGERTATGDSEISATSTRHSRVQSSTTHRIGKRHLQIRLSETKSRLHRWLVPSGSTIGARWLEAGNLRGN